MSRLFILGILLTFSTLGCSGRHVVIDPGEVSGLDDKKWEISKEPSQDSTQPELKEKGPQEEDHPDVATDRENPDEVRHAPNQDQKVIGYHEQALARDPKTYGEKHTDVASDRDRPSGAGRVPAQRQKPIEYDKRAPAGDLKTYGEDPPGVALDRDSPGGARNAPGQRQKAIEHHEQALTRDPKTYGEDPSDVDLLIDGFSWILLLGGSFFVVVSAIGVLRMPDFFTRLHAAGIADTLGVMLIVVGLILQAGLSSVSAKLLLIVMFILFTSPTATHALAKAALHGGLSPVLTAREDDRSKR